ncbi:MAG: RpiB/LacA/LacB family sugar-phosphate isomerase [Candidatus Curtissbacteria bacterium]|nr:RpiB/LacA/LacB family sugar-phosphate isomerase [Candidatus Curtissbacteria bacterium]
MKIYIASDHAGFYLKKNLIQYLGIKGYEVEDVGAFEMDEADDYPDFIIPCAQKVVDDTGSLGIVIGGSGQAESIAANKVKGIRAALFYGPVKASGPADVHGRKISDSFEIVRLARMHNNANILSLGARFQSPDDAKKAVTLFLETKFEGDRHQRRIDKISKLEG